MTSKPSPQRIAEMLRSLSIDMGEIMIIRAIAQWCEYSERTAETSG